MLFADGESQRPCQHGPLTRGPILSRRGRSLVSGCREFGFYRSAFAPDSGKVTRSLAMTDCLIYGARQAFSGKMFRVRALNSVLDFQSVNGEGIDAFSCSSLASVSSVVSAAREGCVESIFGDLSTARQTSSFACSRFLAKLGLENRNEEPSCLHLLAT